MNVMGLDLDDFAAAVEAMAAQWASAGVAWQLHRGPTRDKSAAWVDCSTPSHEAQLIVWTSGEAELVVGEIATGHMRNVHYEMSTLDDLATCLDELTRSLT